MQSNLSSYYETLSLETISVVQSFVGQSLCERNNYPKSSRKKKEGVMKKKSRLNNDDYDKNEAKEERRKEICGCGQALKVVEGQLAPTPRRCSAGCLKYWQCVLEKCGDINTAHTIIPGAKISVAVHNAAVQHPSHGVSRLESDHRGVCRQMRYSSVKTTFHSILPHILLSSHHWRRRHLWFCVKWESNVSLCGLTTLL
ncbi:hypothetical protein TNCV_163931 [Trichonephila clavipes]|nr:hypothetical protein TNCV_163931 [Trichonephila clavipes]